MCQFHNSRFLAENISAFFCRLVYQKKTLFSIRIDRSLPALQAQHTCNHRYPFAELYCTLGIDLEAYGNDHLKVIVLGIACDLTRTFGLNYPEIPDSWIFFKLWIRINLLNMLIDYTNIHIVQGGHHLLCQPYILILIAHLYAVLLISHRAT